MKIKTMHVDAATLDCIQVDSQKGTWCAECKVLFAQIVAFEIIIR